MVLPPIGIQLQAGTAVALIIRTLPRGRRGIVVAVAIKVLPLSDTGACRCEYPGEFAGANLDAGTGSGGSSSKGKGGSSGRSVPATLAIAVGVLGIFGVP